MSAIRQHATATTATVVAMLALTVAGCGGSESGGGSPVLQGHINPDDGRQ
jgi:hypothetical protein